MRRETQNLLLLMLGCAMLKLTLTGTYLRYVKAALWPWLLLAGLVVITLACLAIVRDVRESQRRRRAIADGNPERTGGPERTGCPERGGHTWSTWMLLLPVFAVFLVTPPPLGADSVARAGDAPAGKPESGFTELPPRQVPVLTLSDFVSRARWDDSGALDDREIRLRGFVVHEGGAAQLARVRINCCAADAVAVRVGLDGPWAKRADALPDDTWIEVSGTLGSGSAEDAVPGLDVATVRTIPTPEDPYES